MFIKYKGIAINISIIPFNTSNKRDVSLKWQNLEKRAESNVFLSWAWIGSWLDLITGKVFIVEAEDNNRVVGLGFLVEKERKIFGLFSIKQWYLHRTGNTPQDQIWIEHNDFLLDANVAELVRKEMIDSVCVFASHIHEVIIGLSTDNVIRSFTSCFHHDFPDITPLIETNAYTVETQSYTEEVKEKFINEVLSKNTRSQVARSEKLLKQLGEVDFSIITQADEVRALIKNIAKIHIERWSNSVEGSGFTNSVFNDFHDAMINDDENNVVQIAVLSLNKEPVGYLLNYVYKDQVCFYLSALTSFDDNKIKVGLTLHTKAIQYYIDQGIYSYDFLGGDARYKRSMSNKKYNLVMNCYQRKYLLLKLENKFKNYKAIFKKVLSC
ncbi:MULTISPECIES: GNAT family N-acetyltransferase [unclassified Colwellia]|uniref:GNAT family N-acetyltransferase n=1 Tax=unclassified Colwellia TaxID=196834 RepID=UPI0015F3D298|nr:MULTISPECIES: GNAT family N-acetyltransferase [unclassified Colwellia]MBA6377943.1 GNAT family N-acetyltransferase [Colwellia sp. BRX10-7]MBA6387591.1 GNAT family N-acetyltransferase [Colwellia sp. BRX10-2]MBA6400951.1 GNAT family N-acetyltransferase [Colwellia sp. BRX10-5]MBA6404795.1 GNAT family N-acetyltransferase [Colwellia sp. BRX10-1]